MLASNFGTCVLFQAQSATAHRSAARLVHSCCETSSPPTFLYYQSLATHTELQHYITFLLTKILVWVSQTDSYFNSRHYIIATCKSPHLSAAQLLPPCSWYDPSCSNCKTCETGLACNTWYHHILFGWGSVPTPSCAILKTKTGITYCSLLNLAIAIIATYLLREARPK